MPKKNSRPVQTEAPIPAAGDRRARAQAETSRAARRREESGYTKPSPRWLVPTALTFLVLGLLYLITYYITNAVYPLPIGDWNLAVGMGLILLGGALLTGWK